MSSVRIWSVAFTRAAGEIQLVSAKAQRPRGVGDRTAGPLVSVRPARDAALLDPEGPVRPLTGSSHPDPGEADRQLGDDRGEGGPAIGHRRFVARVGTDGVGEAGMV